ncbi:23S rRNA (adenine(2030)-N(6))-methyltransferase RlmJ [Nitrospirillum sp. BR 11163]|uniref:23S rRNA (adenine(2030)-N(6))-methyltransferase RlmJ n=1 Tax=Nitrospirillum sp. BR 11163 TaxID=3104323 RepID=UPI002AFFA679|nr:23S rRNA (adenine(2030)-N(6))-methyltransferase RlmJ [Nitrospirillum sp. BR 11163]MEA1676053.1 23S rRNA (adenine(2030)-N(6))-methyltransferase RlmJ [Nitrospirillum sp. BR 11163]
MNYRHAFHAGNPADVMKHAILALLMTRLTAKTTPFAVLDTHAGIGRYDLTGDEATRTSEAALGIQRLLQVAEAGALSAPAAEALAPYLDAVRIAAGRAPGQPLGAITNYPGSPCLARTFLRENDRLILAELHPEDARTLKGVFRGDRQVAVHHMDGWTALKAHLPPKEKRGLVLIDPPFEAADDFDRLVAGLALAHGRWPTGIYALWYPIKDRATGWRLHQRLEDSGIPRILAAELTWNDDARVDRLNGSGMILVNPPWQLDETLRQMLPSLHEALGFAQGIAHVEWVAGESTA